MIEKRCFLLLLISLCGAANQPSFGLAPSKGEYQSPYKIVFSIPINELTAPNQIRPRNDCKLESETPYDKWYSDDTRRRFGAWGPQSRKFPPVEGLSARSCEWKRQRVLTVASAMIGLPYQHHHIPDWEPPDDWPWKPVAYGRNSKGMDCSDFTSWVYNYGLGIKLNTGTSQQAEAVNVPDFGDNNRVLIEKIYDENGYDSLVSKLIAGDLLYIKHKRDEQISHVIMWVGKYGQSPDGTPLVIDCTGPDHTDCNGNSIPIGVQIRPFGRSSWYYKSFSHANRIIPAQETGRPAK